MGDTHNFVTMLERVHLGGLIKECIVQVEDNTAIVQAIDLTNSCFVQSVAEIEMPDCKIGIGNMALLIKYLSAYPGEMEMSVSDNRLHMKPKGGSPLKFLLAQPDLISTYDSEWAEEGDMITTQQESYSDGGASMELTQAIVSEFMNLMSMFDPSVITLTVNAKQRLIIHAGSSNSHQFDVKLGKMEIEPCSINVYGKHLVAVLKAVGEEKITLFMKPDSDILIVSGDTGWILNPTEGEATTGDGE